MDDNSYGEKVKRYHRKLNVESADKSTPHIPMLYIGGDWSSRKSLADVETFSNRYHTNSMYDSTANGNGSYGSRAGDASSDPHPPSEARETVEIHNNIRTITKELIVEIPVYTETLVVDQAHYLWLYGRIGLLVLEVKRLQWRLHRGHDSSLTEESVRVSERGIRSEGQEEGFGRETGQGGRQVYEEMEAKFNNLLEKYGDAREEIERKGLEIERLGTERKSDRLEIEHLRRENECAATAMYVDKSNIFGKYKETEEKNARLESRVQVLESEAEAAKGLRVDLGRLGGAFEEKSVALEEMRGKLMAREEDAEVIKGLVAAREKEIEKLNQKNGELIKIAQEYTHVKQMLDIARRDVETYKEAYEARERLLVKLGRELGEVEPLGARLQERESRIAFLEEEVKRQKERVEEKEVQAEILRSRNIDQDLEKFRNNELANQVTQMGAKIEFVEKKLALREDENEGLQRKLVEAAAKIEELKMYEIKLDQIGVEREDLLRQVYELKKELGEKGRLEKEIEGAKQMMSQKDMLMERVKEKVEGLKREAKEAKTKIEEMKGEIVEHGRRQKEADEVKQSLGEAREALKTSRKEVEELEGVLRERDAEAREIENQVLRLKNELKESAEKNKTKISMLQADNEAMEEKLKVFGEVEKRLEKAVLMNADLKNSNENLGSKVEILSQELKGCEVSLERQKEANCQLENKLNIMKEIESKNRDLTANVETMAKEIESMVVQNKKVSLEKEQARQEVQKAKNEVEELRGEVNRKEEEVKEAAEKVEQLREEGEK